MGSKDNIVRGPELERLVDTNLGELLMLLLRAHQDNVLMVDAVTDEELTANVLLAKGIHLAKWLQKNDIKFGKSISVNSENRLEFAIVPVAAFLMGAVFAPINSDYTPYELNHVLSLSKPRLIFCSDRTIEKMLSILDGHSCIKQLVLFGNNRINHPRVTMFNDILEGVTEIDESFEVAKYDRFEAVATILMSSGTTGLPKGVMCTHENMAAFIDISRSAIQNIAFNEDPHDAMLGLTPFFHSFGFMLMFLNLLRGKKMVVLGKFNLEVLLKAIERHKVCRLIVPPPVLVILLKSPKLSQYDVSSLKEIRSGAAALGSELEKGLRDRFKIRDVSQSYGLTETTLGVLMAPFGAAKFGSVGKVVNGMIAKVIDENGTPLGPYKEGELCFKGPLIVKGYIGDPKSTATTIDQDGWLYTGDVGYYDSDEYFFIVDRIKELIKYKGFQVAPAELEALLLTHPSLEDAAVIGVPDDEAGELPLAYVVKKPNVNVTKEEIQKFVADKVSSPKQLRGGVIFVQEIPKNPSGKILRRVLRDEVKKQLKSKL